MKFAPHLEADVILVDAEQRSAGFLHPLAERMAAAREVPQRDDFRGEILKGLVENRIEDVSLGHAPLDGWCSSASSSS